MNGFQSDDIFVLQRQWRDQYGGKKLKPRAAEFPEIEPAPGRYVQQRD